MIDADKYEGHDLAKGRVGSDYNIYDRKGNIIFDADDVGSNMATLNLLADAPLLLAEIKRLREDYEKMSEVLREHGMDICRHCRVIYRDDDMNHPHYPSLHPWHMDGMCMKERIE
jgi:hypothetical protein